MRIGLIDVSALTLGWGLLLLALIGCGPASLSPDEYVAKAEQQLSEGNLRVAAIELKNALQIDADHGRARLLLGRIYLDMGNGTAAEKELQRAVALGESGASLQLDLTRAALLRGDYDAIVRADIDAVIQGTHDKGRELTSQQHAELLALRSMAYLELGQTEVARQKIGDALELDADSSVARTAHARIAIADGDYGSARTTVKSVLDKDPRHAAAWSVLGDLDSYEDRMKDAESAYSQAIQHRQDNLKDYYKRALVRIALDDLEGGRTDIDVIKTRQRRSANAFYALGLWHAAQGDYEKARSALDEAVGIRKNFRAAMFYLGVVNLHLGAWQQAESWLTRFLLERPDYGDARKLLAAARLKVNDHDGAVEVLRGLLTNQPDDIPALNLMADAMLAQGDLQARNAFLEKVVAEVPDSAAAHVKLGLGLMATGRNDEAIEQLEKAVGLEPNLSHVDVSIVLAHFREGRYAVAMSLIQELADKMPSSPLPKNLEGIAHLSLGERDKAKDAFRRALDVKPGYPPAAANLAAAYLEQGNTTAARTVYLSTIESFPNHIPTLLKLATLDERLGNLEASREWLVRAVEADESLLEPRLRLAQAWVNQGRARDAVTLLDAVAEGHSDDISFLATMGRAQLENGAAARALQRFERLAELAPRSANAQLWLAKGYAAVGDVDNADKALHAALSLNPNHVPAKLVLTRLLVLQGKLNRALELVESLEVQKPGSLAVTELRADVELARGNVQAAIAGYQQVVDNFPHPEAVHKLARAQATLGDAREGLTTLERWLAKHEDDLAGRILLADGYMAMGDTEAARSTYEWILARVPDHVRSHNNLSSLWRGLDNQKARKHAERALELAPKSPAVMDTLAAVLLEEGDYVNAERLLRSAAELLPDNTTVQLHLGRALIGQGRARDAKEVLASLLEKDSSSQKAKQAEALMRDSTSSNASEKKRVSRF